MPKNLAFCLHFLNIPWIPAGAAAYAHIACISLEFPAEDIANCKISLKSLQMHKKQISQRISTEIIIMQQIEVRTFRPLCQNFTKYRGTKNSTFRLFLPEFFQRCELSDHYARIFYEVRTFRPLCQNFTKSTANSQISFNA